jgi:gluconolactonase
VFDRHGVLYFSDPWGSSSTSDVNPIGGFYRHFSDGRLERLDQGLAFPNGVAIAADGSAVYLAETGRRRILRYPIAADGAVGPREHWTDVPGPPGPDGMAFDERGFLYVAHYAGGRVAIFAPDGTLADEIPVPGTQVTNCAFGGPNRTTLVITEVETASLYRVELDVAGQRLYSGV